MDPATSFRYPRDYQFSGTLECYFSAAFLDGTKVFFNNQSISFLSLLSRHQKLCQKQFAPRFFVTQKGVWVMRVKAFLGYFYVIKRRRLTNFASKL